MGLLEITRRDAEVLPWVTISLTPQGLCHWLCNAVHWICMEEANPPQVPARLSAEQQILDDNVF